MHSPPEPLAGEQRRQRITDTASNVVLGLVLAVLTWSFSAANLVVAIGTDGSWRSVLEMAAHRHMEFGTRIVFTYGPLGFLTAQQLNYAGTALAAFVYALLFSTALFATLVWALRRTFPLWCAVLIAYVVGGVCVATSDGAAEDILAVVLIIAVSCLNRPKSPPASVWTWAGLGIVLSVFSLIKVSLGVGIALILVIALACLPRDRVRALGALAGGAVPALGLAWFGTGNGVDNLIPFAKSSAAVTDGYAAAMSYDYPYRGYPAGLIPNRTFTYWWAAVVAVVIAAVVVTYVRGSSRRARVGLTLMTVGVVWLLFREGFVRHDRSHDLIYFAAAPLVVVAFDFGKRFGAAVLLCGLIVLTAVSCVVAGAVPSLLDQPWAAAHNFVHEATAIGSTRQRDEVMARSRQELRTQYDIPPSILASIRGHTVDIAPREQTVAWAYPGVRFDPLPIIQDYSAYTSSLDALDRDDVASPAAPRFILRLDQPPADGRNATFEPPATQLAIECRYRQVIAASAWQLLERSADDCGTTHALRTVTTGFDQWVHVPTGPAGDAVVATFRLPLGLSWKAQEAVFKPPNIFMDVNDGSESWRFVAGTASDLHVLRPASTLGYSEPFQPIAVNRFRFTVNGQGGGTSGLQVSFFEVPVVSDR